MPRRRHDDDQPLLFGSDEPDRRPGADAGEPPRAADDHPRRRRTTRGEIETASNTGGLTHAGASSAEDPDLPRPATVTPDMVTLARELPRSIRLGTSSWSFPGWQGHVFANQPTMTSLAREGLAAYAQHPMLRTVGIDKTFYRPAPASEFARLARQVGDEFRFLVKAHEAITRRDGGDVASRWLDAHYASDQVIGPCVEGLGSKAGPIVFQFTPQGIRRDRDADEFIGDLARFLGALPRGPLYAVEVRDRRLLRAAYREALHHAGVAHCFNIHPSMPPLPEQAKLIDPIDGPALVVRWMLHSGYGYEEALARYEPFARIVDPDPDGRAAIARFCRAATGAGLASWVIVNNKAEGSAPLSVFELARNIIRGAHETHHHA